MRVHAAAAIAVAICVWPSSVFAQPFAQQGSKLVGTGAVGLGRQGTGVAISSDGNTAIVGGIGDTSSAGAVWIYTRSDGVWSQQGSKLVGTGATGAAQQGSSVGLSADGNTAVVGGARDNGDVGAMWIFVRDGTGVWSQQGPKLVGTGATGGSFMGISVAISADGDTVLVGGTGFFPDTSEGAAWVFTRDDAGTWSQQGSKLTASGAIGSPRFGFRVALSADGDRALIGGYADNNFAGAAWVFTRNGSTWTQEGSKLTASDATGNPSFGSAVALSADGATAAIGGNGDNSSVGAVWIFTRSGSTWTQQGTKLVGAESFSGSQGTSVSLSSNGNLLWEGSPGNSTTGGSFEFVRTNGSWTQVGPKLVGSGSSVVFDAFVRQGDSSFLSSDGRTAIVGGPQDNDTRGAAWIFTRVIPAMPEHGAGDVDADGRIDAPLLKTNGDWAFLKSSTNFVASLTLNWTAPGSIPVRGDFDGDNQQDPALYDPVTGVWKILRSSTNFVASMVVSWGGAGYLAVPGDYDGDGRTDPAVYQSSTGTWLILESSTGYATSKIVTFGGPGFTPIPGQDFDGDFIADLAVYRQSTGVWSVRKSSTAFATGFDIQFGGPGYTLVPADYDGDRKTDLGVYDRVTGGWYILKSSSGFTSQIIANWGGPGYLPVPGLFDGDAMCDLGLYQPSTGNWYILLGAANFTTSMSILGWGSGSDRPFSTAIVVGANDVLRAGDHDGDGRSDITTYDSTSGEWATLTSSSGFVASTKRSWGGSSYTAVPGDYDGDMQTDLGLYDVNTGYWYVLLSSAGFGAVLSKSAGGGFGWVPVPRDYDGDGRTDFVVYNATTGQWYGLTSSTNYTPSLNVSWGGSGYTAVPADYDGDGKTDIGVYKSSTGVWSVLLSSTNNTTTLEQTVGSILWPVPADYDGDGKADFVTYNNTTGQWLGLTSGSGYATTIDVMWGGYFYVPVKGDYDGDGKADFATYYLGDGTWHILLSRAEYVTSLTRTWGTANLVAVPQFP